LQIQLLTGKSYAQSEPGNQYLARTGVRDSGVAANGLTQKNALARGAGGMAIGAVT
jgi:hypothetical protein